MSPDRPSTKLVYDAFNMQESAKINQTEMLNLSTKENLRNKISLSISSASNVSTPVSNASIVTPSQVSTPTPSIGGRQPLEPFMPLRKLSYNHNVNANRQVFHFLIAKYFMQHLFFCKPQDVLRTISFNNGEAF